MHRLKYRDCNDVDKKHRLETYVYYEDSTTLERGREAFLTLKQQSTKRLLNLTTLKPLLSIAIKRTAPVAQLDRATDF